MLRVTARRLLTVVSILLLAALAAGPVLAANPLRLVQANEARIAAMLQAKGKIPAGASQDQIDQIVQAYLAKIMRVNNDWVNPAAARKLQAREAASENANLLKGKKLGNLVSVPAAVDSQYGAPSETGKILMLLVEFGGAEGPLHNQMESPDRTVDNTTNWVPDFSTEHYQNMLYDQTPGAPSMANWYLQQSNGQYTVEGQAFGWYKVPFPEYVYGRDTADDNDNAIKNPAELIRDLVTAMATEGKLGEIPWQEYAGEDGYIGHIMIVHAGAGQEGGGGAQGDDAIWSHSSFADWANGGIEIPGQFTADGTPIRIGAYTMMPEDGAIGVFCHEFGHDLGLPDEYDTIYSGESSPAFWSCMASGSWLGDDQELSISPSSFSIWGRVALGWVAPSTVTLNQLKSGAATFKLDHSNHLTDDGAQAVRISLPPKTLTIDINRPYAGEFEWYSGMGDEMDLRLTRSFDLTGVGSAHLNFMTWYDIEQDWDYGYVEVSADGGTTWTALPSTVTTNDNPNSQNSGNGITGTSAGWIPVSFDLSAFAGQQVLVRFRYWTDAAMQGKGWAIDEITISEAGYYDGGEAGNGGWTLASAGNTPGAWRLFRGLETQLKSHYYLLEYRDFTGFDQSLKYCYNYADATSNWAERFSYNPGVLLWYRDTSYTENWVGVHPGRGFLLLVDSHDTILRSPILGTPWRTRMQVMDAPFGVKRTLSNTLTRYGRTQTYQSLSPVPNFDDKQSYLNPSYPIPGTILPKYGISFRVLGEAADQSAALVSLTAK